jgi:hypothetical protein
MALSSTEKELFNTWSTVISSVGDDVARWLTFYYTDRKLAGKYLEIAGNAEEVTKLFTEVRKEYADKKHAHMDPITAFDIINGVFWPTIVTQDAAMVDHPSDGSLNSMRGIPISWVFTSKGGQIEKGVFFSKLLPGISGGSVNTNPIRQAAAALSDALDQLIAYNSSLSEADQKEALSLLFQTENAAKLYWIYFGAKSSLGKPINTLRWYNPYLSYFNWTLGWQSGDKGIATHGVKAAVENFIPNFYVQDGIDLTELGATIQQDNPEKALGGLVNTTNAAVQAQYAWLQKQKTNDSTKQYYTEWFNRFFTTPKSLINMVIIINEKVNLDPSKQFTHSQPCREKLNKIGLAYQSAFKINIGD